MDRRWSDPRDFRLSQRAQRPVVGQDGRRPGQTHGPAEAQKAQQILADHHPSWRHGRRLRWRHGEMTGGSFPKVVIGGTQKWLVYGKYIANIWLIYGWYMVNSGFPKSWGYPQSSSISRWDFPWNQPSSYWGSPMTSWKPPNIISSIFPEIIDFLENDVGEIYPSCSMDWWFEKENLWNIRREIPWFSMSFPWMMGLSCKLSFKRIHSHGDISSCMELSWGNSCWMLLQTILEGF